MNLKRQPNENSRVLKSRILKLKYEKIQESHFKNELNFNQINDSNGNVLKNIQSLGKRHKETKNKLLELFSNDNWKKLSDVQKEKHTLFNCNGCLRNKELKAGLTRFPIPKNSLHNKNKAKYVKLFKEKVLTDITNNIVNNLDAQYKSEFKTTFTRQFLSINGKLDSKETEIASEIKNDFEEQWSETSVER